MEIKWQRGVFLKFFAQMKIRVGGKDALDIMKGDEFEYDGSILKYSGLEVAQPQLRGAIRSGWASLNEYSDNASIAPMRPDRNVARSQTVNRDLSKVQRTGPNSMETSEYDEVTVLNVGDRAAPSKGADPRILKASDNRKGMAINVDEVEAQEAVTIGRVRTSTHAKFDATNASNASQIITKLENITPKAQIYTSEGVQVKMNVSKPSSEISDSENEGRVVGQVRHTKTAGSDGISVTDTSNIRADRAARDLAVAKASKSAKKQQTDQMEKPISLDSKVKDPRIRMAKVIYPSFPDKWEFTGKLADRLAAVKRHGASKEFISALFAAEGDQMRKVLMKEYPQFLLSFLTGRVRKGPPRGF